MGGRGSSSSGKSSVSTGGGGSGGTFYDKTSTFAGMSLHDFENAIRGKSNEYVGVFDSSGNLLIAGTSYQKGSVAVPNLDPRFANASIVTHNHPSDGGRGIGGTFSEADIKMLGLTGVNAVRAVANGKGEHTYIMQKSTTRSANPNGLVKAAERIKSSARMSKTGQTTLAQVEKKLAAQGKTLTGTQKSAIYLGSMKNTWKSVAEKNGYDYIPLKKAPW